jgi:hypothetical protein
MGCYTMPDVKMDSGTCSMCASALEADTRVSSTQGRMQAFSCKTGHSELWCGVPAKQCNLYQLVHSKSNTTLPQQFRKSSVVLDCHTHPTGARQSLVRGLRQVAAAHCYCITDRGTVKQATAAPPFTHTLPVPIHGIASAQQLHCR